MRIRFIHPSTARLSFQPGDEIVVSALTPELKALLDSTRIDREHVVEVVRDDGMDVPEREAEDELALPHSRGRRRA